MATTLEILKAARAKIADPERWTQSVYAENALGEAVLWDADDACRWCAYGAVFSITAGDSASAEMQCLSESAWALFGTNVLDVNDDGGHPAILRCFDHAIAKLEAEK